MPGIIVFRRRWSVGSDDLVVPGVFLFILHTIWLIILAVIYGLVERRQEAEAEAASSESCWRELQEQLIGYLVILSSCCIIEAAIAFVAMRGTILDPSPRASMQYLLYIRLCVLACELVWLVLGVVWLAKHYKSCSSQAAADAILDIKIRNIYYGIVVCNWAVMVSVVLTVWCTFDAAGRSWVKMKRYQRSMRDSKSKFQYRRSGNRNRNWRQRKVLRAYQDSWDHRCSLLFCCVRKSNDTNSNSFADIARLLSEFFRDLDVVPSDVVAGLVLLRKYQKLERHGIVKNNKNDTYEFLSGVPITPSSRFLQLSSPEGNEEFHKIVHYMRFALAIYGWPMYVMAHSTLHTCKLIPRIRCCRCCAGSDEMPQIIEDNCCGCNTAALQDMAPSEGVEMVYITYHVDVGETPFFVAMDHSRRAIVISIRGTLSMKDVVTDLNAESEPIPMDSIKEDWLGHKGMVFAAEYIRKKLREEGILDKAFSSDPSRGTHNYDIVLVGHSLGAGTAAILAILLKQQHPNLSCFAYSPPGGLLSMPVVEYSKPFITSVVVGKDVVPRIGLHQMETLRADLINAIQKSKDPKWKTISSSVRCCGGYEDTSGEAEEWSSTVRDEFRDPAVHPFDSSIALTWQKIFTTVKWCVQFEEENKSTMEWSYKKRNVHQPMFPPGRILHIVRHHPAKREQKYESRFRRWFKRRKPVYQGVWVDNRDFKEVLISPCMVQDHMPDTVLKALEKVIIHSKDLPLQTRAPPTNTESSSRLQSNSHQPGVRNSRPGQAPESNGDVEATLTNQSPVYSVSRCWNYFPKGVAYITPNQ